MSCAVHPLQDDTIPCARCGTAYCDDCLVLLRNERLCGECKQNTLRDVVSGTHENLRLARVQARAAAYIIDRAMYYALLVVGLRGVTLMEGRVDWHFVNIAIAGLVLTLNAAYLAYEALMLTKRGQTLGKMAAQVRVGRRDGTPLTRRQAWSRAAIRIVFVTAWLAVIGIGAPPFELAMVLFFLGIIDPIVAAFTPQRTAIHDLLAGTRVYRAE